MSSPMWTPGALASEARAYRHDIWRVVETQYKTATLRLTDTLAEQAALERVLERTKPPIPPECAGLDFLLAAPFRYAPYPMGSRFRRAGQPEGAFYASETVETAIAETAFHRLLFLAESPATKFPSQPIEHTAFGVPCRTRRLIDLTRAPLVRDRAIWTSPADYGPCQDLADAARAGGIEALRYQSVRDPEHRANVVVLSPKAFAARSPRRLQTWHVFPRPHAVQARRESPRLALEFPIAVFANDPRLKTLRS